MEALVKLISEKFKNIQRWINRVHGLLYIMNNHRKDSLLSLLQVYIVAPLFIYWLEHETTFINNVIVFYLPWTFEVSILSHLLMSYMIWTLQVGKYIDYRTDYPLVLLLTNYWHSFCVTYIELQTYGHIYQTWHHKLILYEPNKVADRVVLSKYHKATIPNWVLNPTPMHYFAFLTIRSLLVIDHPSRTM